METVKHDRDFWHVGRDRLEIRSRRLQRDQLAAFEVFELYYEIGSHAGLEETCRDCPIHSGRLKVGGGQRLDDNVSSGV